jgi:cobalt-zinc-cadmium efflux system membrane fusion protein
VNRRASAILLAVCVTLLAGCGVRGSAASGEGAPPPAVVEHDGDGSALHVEHPERFPLATATTRQAATALTVTGVVSPDVTRAVPVVSLSSGRVIELRARLGDRVKRGQVLLRVQSVDVATAIADHRKARADDVLARTQFERARDLYALGAVAKKDLDVAQDAADKATVDVENSAERLHVLGIDPGQAVGAAGIVNVVAPASGVITEQNVTNAAGIKTLDNSPNLFTISDLSRVWIICDVHENDLSTVRIGDTAEIHLAAYPDHALSGLVNDIASILDPNLRTAKVRIEVANPGLMRIGMFVTATFHGRTVHERAVVPATAILHLHDRDWVYVPFGTSAFQRREVVGGQMLSGNMEEIVSGLQPGARVVSNALVFQNTSEQQGDAGR